MKYSDVARLLLSHPSLLLSSDKPIPEVTCYGTDEVIGALPLTAQTLYTLLLKSEGYCEDITLRLDKMLMKTNLDSDYLRHHEVVSMLGSTRNILTSFTGKSHNTVRALSWIYSVFKHYCPNHVPEATAALLYPEDEVRHPSAEVVRRKFNELFWDSDRFWITAVLEVFGVHSYTMATMKFKHMIRPFHQVVRPVKHGLMIPSQLALPEGLKQQFSGLITQQGCIMGSSMYVKEWKKSYARLRCQGKGQVYTGLDAFLLLARNYMGDTTRDIAVRGALLLT